MPAEGMGTPGPITIYGLGYAARQLPGYDVEHPEDMAIVHGLRATLGLAILNGIGQLVVNKVLLGRHLNVFTREFSAQLIAHKCDNECHGECVQPSFLMD